MSTAVIDKKVSVSNGASVDVLPIDAYTPSSNGGSTPVAQQMYEQTLTPLKTVDGAATIKAGASASVELDGTWDDGNGTTQYRTVYDLIFARPADLFPVNVIGEMLGIVNPVYPPISIASTDQANYILALKFLINLMAYPTSNLATNYQAALTAAGQNSNKPGDTDSAMAAFFASTQQYKSLTLGHVTAVTTYVNTFAFLWAGAASDLTSFNTSCTYYVYKAGVASPGSSSAAPTLVGTLALVQTANRPSPASVTDANAGYTCTFTDPDGKSTAMYYQAGQFVSDTTSDTPNITLKGSYVLKSLLTNDATDTVLVSMVAGQIGGVKVLGTTTKQSTSEPDSQFWAFFHPTTFGGWLNLFLSFFGILMALEFMAKGVTSLGKGIKSLWDKYQGKQPPQSEIDQLRSDVKGLREEIRQNQQDLLDRLDPDRDAQVPEEEDFSDTESEVEVALVDNRRSTRRIVVEDALQAQASQVETIAKYEVSPKLERVAENIRQDTQAIQESTDPKSLDTALDHASGNLSDDLNEIEAMIKEADSQATTEEQVEMKTSQEAVEELKESEKAVNESQETAEEGSGADEDLPIGEDVIG